MFICASFLKIKLKIVKFLNKMIYEIFFCLSAVAHFHHVIELLRFRQSTLSGILLSAGEGPLLGTV